MTILVMFWNKPCYIANSVTRGLLRDRDVLLSCRRLVSVYICSVSDRELCAVSENSKVILVLLTFFLSYYFTCKYSRNHSTDIVFNLRACWVRQTMSVVNQYIFYHGRAAAWKCFGSDCSSFAEQK